MKRVVGLGGIFFKAEDPQKLSAWYKQHLGLPMSEWGATFREGVSDDSVAKREACTIWAPFDEDTQYFGPSVKPFMINFRVDDLDALLAQLTEEGVSVDEKREESELGKFGWIMDPEGNRVELWEPPLAK